MKKRLISCLALVLALAMLLTACGTSAGKSSGGLKQINVAFEFALSGPAAWVGSLMKAATQVALDDYKDDLAALGYEINAIYNDHEGSNDTAALICILIGG